MRILPDDLYEDLLEFLEDQEDADCKGDPPQYIPNKAMKLALRLKEGQFEKALMSPRELEKTNQALIVAAERALYDDALILKFEDILGKAVEVIKQWHNMGGGEDVWQIYYENAPEMQPIRALLTCSTDRRE